MKDQRTIEVDFVLLLAAFAMFVLALVMGVDPR